jgi:hypothetical protein
MVRIFLYLIGSIAISSCSSSTETISDSTPDIQETAQQLGDIMASIDEAGGGDGDFTALNEIDSEVKSAERMFARVQPERDRFAWLKTILPNAVATTCSAASTFSTCSADQIIRTFGGCTLDSTTFNGSVTLTWVDGNVSATTCAIDTDGDTITRVPAFTITGRRGGTLTVSKSGAVGQRITRTSNGVYSFTNDGIDRVLNVAGTDIFDFTTTTTAPVTITGSTRNGRVVNGGTIRVTNNLTAVTCDYVPSNLTWSNACTCPVSGSWSTTCSDGKASTYTIQACRYGRFVMGGDAETVVLDRCYAP